MVSFHLAHEHIHALKETNYAEYVDGFIVGDVITMLYEFILADTYSELNMKYIDLDYIHKKKIMFIMIMLLRK